MKVNSIIALATQLAVLAGGLSANAQTSPSSQSQPAPAWTTKCESPDRTQPLACSVEQRINMQKTGRQILKLSIGIDKAGSENRTLLIQLPLGLSNSAGVSVVVDENEPVRFELQTCEVSGCYAGGIVNNQLLDSFKRGSKGSMNFKNNQQLDISIPITLQGFSAAFDRVK